jgi:hypothetical protein
MDKRWLSQLLTDSAFPLLVLSLAVSQIELGPRRNANVLNRDRQSTELRANGRRPEGNSKIWLEQPERGRPSLTETYFDQQMSSTRVVRFMEIFIFLSCYLILLMAMAALAG